MDYRFIKNMTKRQFDSVMSKEGVEIKDYFNEDINYKVFFRKAGRGTNTQGKLKLFYSQDTPITIGTCFKYKNNAYIVNSCDGIESEVYYTSVATKCDTFLNIKNNDKYIPMPFVTMTDKYNTNSGTITTIDGTVVVYTSLNDVSRSIKVNDSFYNYGGYYTVGNYFYSNNICYIYMTRSAIPKDENYKLVYIGKTEFNLDDEKEYMLSYSATNNDISVSDAQLSYEITSGVNVVTVSQDGLLTLLSSGAATITTTWKDGNNTTCTTEIEVKEVIEEEDREEEKEDEELIPTPTLNASIKASNDTIKVGGSYKAMSMIFSNNEGVDVTTETILEMTKEDFTWNFTIEGVEYKDNTSVLTILDGTTINGIKVKFANDRSYLTKILKVKCTCEKLNLSAERDLTISV